MNAVAVYEFPATGQQIRVIVRDGAPWFVARDACAVLEIANGRDAVARLDSDEKDVGTTDTPGGPQQTAIVSEAGLYQLIFQSRKPEAKTFRRWVTHDVLPTIRKTGGYGTVAHALPQSYADALRELASTVEERDVARAELAEAAPKADAWNTLAAADGDFAVADAAKILSRDPKIKLGRDRLFSLMESYGWVYRQGVDRRWRVYQDQVENGRLSELPSSHYHPRTGELVLDPPQVRVTVKGMEEIRRRVRGST